jgi:O-antigen/teichoic acid export membrane protein
MFIVTPFISSKQAIYGIYSVCISLSIFLSYADIGFLGAGQKYAAEEFARGNLDLERRIVGFSGFILLAFVLVCTLVFGFLAGSPKLLIPSITIDEGRVASRLLLILALAAPVTVLQRVAQMIYAVRIEDFVFQRMQICGSVAKMASAFFFFSGARYDIVGYFAFAQVMNLFVSVVALAVANRRFRYDLGRLARALRFDRMLFRKMQRLAFNSFFLTLSWVLYYECDTMVIGQLLGAEKIAVYAIGLTLMTFLRSILGSLFSPFTSRFNHFIGLGDGDGLRRTVSRVVQVTLPVVVLTVATIAVLMKPLVYTWVGPGYDGSVGVARLLVCCNLFAFITYPTAMLLSAHVRVKALYLMGAILPVVYWVGVAVTYRWLGLESFGVFKLVSFSVTAAVYLGFLLRYLGISVWKFLARYVARNLPALAVLFAGLMLLRTILPQAKGAVGLLAVIGSGGTAAILSIAVALALNPEARGVIASLRKRDALEE